MGQVITIDQLGLNPQLTAHLKRACGEKLGDLLRRSYDELLSMGFYQREIDEIELALRESNLHLNPPYR
jgi:hypothetical protein